jgi:hypothetical protein
MIRGASYSRRPNDLYRTPPAVAHALLDTVAFGPVLCDPCCGYGDMLAVFRERGHEALGSDIEPHARGAVTADFLRGPFPYPSCDIVTNPPAGPRGRLAVGFIERALTVTRPWRGKVAMLLRRDFDSAATRVHLFRDHPAFAATVVLLGRVVWFSPAVARPAENHGWFIWDWQHSGRPTTIYVPLEKHDGFLVSSLPERTTRADARAAPC